MEEDSVPFMNPKLRSDRSCLILFSYQRRIGWKQRGTSEFIKTSPMPYHRSYDLHSCFNLSQAIVSLLFSVPEVVAVTLYINRFYPYPLSVK